MLTSKCKAIITDIKKKSSSDMFKKLGIGDILIFEIPISKIRRNSGGCHATMVKITNQATGEFTEKSMNNLLRILDNFELQDCDTAHLIHRKTN